jgi:hypothetical protein
VRITTVALYALPLSAAAVVAFALFVVGAPKPYAGARLYGGPTEGVSRLSFRLAVVESYRGVESAAEGGAVDVVVSLAGGGTQTWHGTLDQLGMAAVALELPEPVASPVSVRVVRDRATLADGRVWLSVDEWRSHARGSGGFYDVPSKGELSIRVAPARGALAVPFAEALWIEVRRQGHPVAGAEIHVEPEGLKLIVPKSAGELVRTNADGFAKIVVAPLEHATALRVAAQHQGKQGEWYATVPVIPGAFFATLQGARLRIESPVVRDVAFYVVLNQRARLAGGPVALAPDGRGGAMALVDLPALPDGPIWAAISSEPELASPTTVGWPLRVPNEPHGRPATTLEVADRLLLEGLARGERVESERRKSARLIAGGYTLLALLVASLIVIVRARSAEARLRRHLADVGTDQDTRDRIAQRRPLLWIVIAVLCIALGFAVIALVALYRLG